MTATKIRCCRYRSNGQELVGQILTNQGLGFKVLPDGEDTFPLFVHKKHIICQWDEGEPGLDPAPEVPTEPIDPTSLAGQVANLTTSTPKKKAELPKPEEGEKTIQLKALCIDFGIEPRIARRRLRKALGNVGTGSRWEWPLNSPELEEVKKVLNAAEPEPEPEPEPSSGMDAPVEG